MHEGEMITSYFDTLDLPLSAYYVDLHRNYKLSRSYAAPSPISVLHPASGEEFRPPTYLRNNVIHHGCHLLHSFLSMLNLHLLLLSYSGRFFQVVYWLRSIRCTTTTLYFVGCNFAMIFALNFRSSNAQTHRR